MLPCNVIVLDKRDDSIQIAASSPPAIWEFTATTQLVLTRSAAGTDQFRSCRESHARGED